MECIAIGMNQDVTKVCFFFAMAYLYCFYFYVMVKVKDNENCYKTVSFV